MKLKKYGIYSIDYEGDTSSWENMLAVSLKKDEINLEEKFEIY